MQSFILLIIRHFQSTKLEEAPEMFVKETVDISEIIASTLSDVGLLLPGKT
jgi:hypothetical protein